ncbi:MAG: NAD synthetase [Planctomycetes bacterium]|jgi:NAD(P) transhydrogenase subunit beta|nr:NAD synthetase [Planctomycetota bacterium]MDP6424179.1 NAD(P)(+) transhydrogenase (Re/Si-specific) subunit beta [Planctomycetota bacterium]
MDPIRMLLFLSAAVCFILGLKLLGRADTARRGNAISALGMALAVIGTLFQIQGKSGLSLDSLLPVLIGVAIGAAIGVPVARKVQMTAMPEMVALFNGFGGIASLLVAWAALHVGMARVDDGLVAASTFLAMLIGGVTFTGSLVAYGKLSGKVTAKPVLYDGQNLVNGAVLLVVLIALVWFTAAPANYWLFLLVLVISLFLGVVVVIPIGGADMPVVISLMNSYSGLAACAAGLAVENNLLIITGALVGASGIVLTRIMCKAMNRSLANVLFSGFGAAEGAGPSGEGEKREHKAMTPDDAYYILEAAQGVVIVPGYGMAVAQAQHAVRELAELLEANGCEVKFAIHPVAGRMPGHMNVLLAEANVPYEQLVEPDDVNPSMEMTDVVIVIGANDVVNPAARDDTSSPIYGMPIIDCDKARTCFVLKRSMASGFAGVDNPLFYGDNSYMIFGDAKKTVEALLAEFKEALVA